MVADTVIPMLGRQGEGDPRGLLASQPSLIGEISILGLEFMQLSSSLNILYS